MISSSISFPSSSSFPPALARPQAQKAEGEPEGSVAQDVAGGRSSVPDSPQAKQDRAKAAQDRKLIAELARIDRVVRTHEQAHLAAAGGLATSGATYGYRRGPDGVQYAVSGEVSIDMSPGRTPQETIAKAERIQAAAVAPADPSPQDRAVAGSAAKMKMQAQQQLVEERLAAAKAGGIGSRPTAAPSPRPAEAAVAGVHPGIASYRASGAEAAKPGGQINAAV